MYTTHLVPCIHVQEIFYIIYKEVELLGPRVYTSSILIDIANVLSRTVLPIYTLTSNVGEYLFSHILAKTGFIR